MADDIEMVRVYIDLLDRFAVNHLHEGLNAPPASWVFRMVVLTSPISSARRNIAGSDRLLTLEFAALRWKFA